MPKYNNPKKAWQYFNEFKVKAVPLSLIPGIQVQDAVNTPIFISSRCHYGALLIYSTSRYAGRINQVSSGIFTTKSNHPLLEQAGVTERFNSFTKLHGPWRASSCGRIIDSQAVRQALVDPGIQKIITPFARPAIARL